MHKHIVCDNIPSNACTGGRPGQGNQPAEKPITTIPVTKAGNNLEQNYPNPFGQETTIQYSLAEPANVKLTVYDLNGRIIKVLVNGSKDAGTHTATFNSGPFKKGLYFYKLQAGNFSAVKKMIIQ